MPIVKGDSPKWTITLLNQEGDPLDLRGHTITVTFKSQPADEIPVFQHFIKVNEAGAVTDEQGMALGPGGFAGGVIIESLSVEESEAVTVKRCKGDLEVRYDDQVHTPLNAVTEEFVDGYTNAVPG